MSRKEQLAALMSGLVVIGIWALTLALAGQGSARRPADLLPTEALLPTLQPTASIPTLLAQPADISQQPTEIPIENRIIIYFAPESTQAEREAYVTALGGTVARQLAPLNAAVLTLPAPIELPESPVIAASEPDHRVTALLDVPTSDPHYAEQWGLSVIGVPEAWLTLPESAPQVRVAVIDSGVCAGHPDLVGRVLAGYDFVDDDTVPDDAFGHGCAVTGVIAANVDNGEGMAGIAPNAQIMPLRVLDAQGVGTYSDVAAALIYAVDQGAQVINLSLGGPNASGLLADAVRYAVERDVLVIAAAGNTGREGVLYPAAYPDVIAVGSIDANLQRSSFSTYGPQIALLAPGRDILSTRRDGTYASVSGTSMAAPHVSGAAALLLAQGQSLRLDGGILSLNAVDVIQPSPVPVVVPPQWQALYDKVLAQGQVRVIVGLNTAYQAESLLSGAQMQAQRADIAQAQQALLVNLAAYNVEVLSQSTAWTIPALGLKVDRAGLEYLMASPEVSRIYEDRPVPVTLVNSVPRIDADDAWSLGFDGTGQAVAVLDTGVDYNHQMLDGDKLVGEACFSTIDPLYNVTSLCPGNLNSYPGINDPGSARPNARCLASGDCFHGTHVAAIAVGKEGSSLYAPNGVAPGASLVAIQVFSRFDGPICQQAFNMVSPCLLSFVTDQISALNHLKLIRPDLQSSGINLAAVNMSLGGGFYTGYCDSLPQEMDTAALINDLFNVGVATIVSSGNSAVDTGSYVDGVGSPACIQNAVSVGSTTSSNTVSNFSQSAPTLDLLAPGQSIISAYVGTTNQYASASGTSMAAPHVAGAWAILKQAKPNAAVNEILNAFSTTGLAVLDTRGGINRTRPRIDVDNALAVVIPPLVVNTTSDTDDGTCNASHCSLREAINTANSTIGLKENIRFSIGSGLQTIVLGTEPLPAITDPVIIDGKSQPGSGSAPRIEIDGTNVTQIDPLLEIGLNVVAGNTIIRGLSITNFGSAAINLSLGSGSVVTANYLGLKPNGTTAAPNREGVRICSSSNNVIGGTTSTDRNVISGNSDDGINLCQLPGQGLSANNFIQGNYIGVTAAGTGALGNGDDGIKIEDAANTLIGGTSGTTPGGACTGACNVISGNGANGIRVVGPEASGHIMQGNYIGTNASGTLRISNQGSGIILTEATSANLIGGTSSSARNIISGNGFNTSTEGHDGIAILNGSSNNVVQGNYIGLLTDGMDVARNGHTGIWIQNGSSGNLIGATNTSNACLSGCNAIAGNPNNIRIVFADNNTITGNHIGMNANGTSTTISSGYALIIAGGSNNILGGTATGAGNKISGSAFDGVYIINQDEVNATGNAILGNRIHTNTGLGIDLDRFNGGLPDGVTANDAGDGDSGANNLQNFPVLTSANATYNTVTIGGTLNSTANTTFRVEFFYNNTCDPSGNGEGQFYLGAQNVTTNGSGDATFTANFPAALSAGQQITATATSPGNNTSEFSPCQAASVNANILVVNTSSGARDNVCNAHCSLPDAVQVANNLAGTQTIQFDIPGAGPHTIQPTAVVPTFSNLIIDATTQPGYAGTPIVTVSGASLTTGSGLNPVTNTTIRGLMIRNFAAHGILITGANNVIGGPNAGDGNVISGNGGAGVSIEGEAADSNTVDGNRIGTASTGLTALPNALHGVQIGSGADGNQIGSEEAGNLIAGNTGSGVYISGATSQVNIVTQNNIGTNGTATSALPNGQHGVELVGSTLGEITNNIISGNLGSGIYLNGALSTTILGNAIGTDAGSDSPAQGIFPAAQLPNGQHGIWIKGGSDTITGGIDADEQNIIAFNGADGIYIESGTGHDVRANVITANGGLGIDLGTNGITPNDSGDGDSGANGLQNFPVITEVIATVADVHVSGILNSTANATFQLDFYDSEACDSSGNGEGRWYLGTEEVSTNGSGSGGFDVTLPAVVDPGTFITITATNSAGSTSEFSACAQAVLYSVTPLDFSVTVLSEIDIQLAWTDDSIDETHWRVERSLAGQNNWTQIASIPTSDEIGTGAAVEYHDTAFLCSRSYDYRVRAFNEPGGYYSRYTPVENGSPICPPLNPPDSLALTPAQREMLLTWTDTNTTENGYRIDHSADGGQTWALLATTLPNAQSYTHIGLICGSNHSYRIRAVRDHDNSLSVTTPVQADVTTICPPLNAPGSPAASALAVNAIQFTWADGSPGQTTAFHLERSANGTDWTQFAVVPYTTLSVIDSSLNCGTNYQYRARAYRLEDNAFSPYSTPTSANTLNCPTPITHTVGLYKDGVWQFWQTTQTNQPAITFSFGPQESGWTPVIGDWDGNGVDGIGVYRNGLWVLRNATGSGSIDNVLVFGPQESGWQPIVGDWDGDGIDGIGVYKDGVWLLRQTPTPGQPSMLFSYGPAEPGWKAIAGDWNGSGAAKVGLFKDGLWLLSNRLPAAADVPPFALGQSGWQPVAGDWDENGSETVGLYKDGLWQLRNSNSSGLPDATFGLAIGTGWQPVAIYEGGLSGLTMLSLPPDMPPTAEATTPAAVTPTTTPDVTPELEITEEPTVEATEDVIPTHTPEPAPTETPAEVPPPTATPTAEDAEATEAVED